MQTVLRRCLAGIAMLGTWVGLAGQADAAYLIIDNNNPVLTQPLNGSVTFTYTGRVSLDAGYSVGGLGLNATLTNERGDTITLSFAANLSDLAAANNGGVYSGNLVSFTIPRYQVGGFYQTLPTSANTYFISASNSAGATQNLMTRLNATVVPEPASLALVGLGLAGVGLMLGKRSRA